MSYELAKLLPPTETGFRDAKNRDDAKVGASRFLRDRDQPPGTYVLLSSDPDNGKHSVIATYEVKTETNVVEVLARFEL
jgi:hypothetical protein